ncbi:MAG: hypothetical protein P8R42_30220 [Candidatus Binatia bacterium]|nr:hypothetical protein [Candidatus Binatia bacterium]
MGEKRSAKATATRVRRARREDIPTLIQHAGGPAAGRVRALRRLLKTLTADVYVVDREGALCGVVAVHYRRSLAHGGLLATIDAMVALRPGDEASREDLGLLVDCAVTRAKRRGCVGIDSGIAAEEVRSALREHGFEAGPEQLGRPLRLEEDEG